jgi:3-dehydroquinate dehydratase-2
MKPRRLAVTRRLFVLNGPNLNMLGRREPHLYGTTTLAEIERRCRALAEELDFELFFAQSNQEGQLIDWVHEAKDDADAVVINPAGLSFGSAALHDALVMLHQPVVEVHLTNIFRGGPVYQDSLAARSSWGLIAGLGPDVYELAMHGLARRLAAG